MATNKIQKFQDITLVQYFLNGAIIGEEVPKNQPPAAMGWFDLAGLTLVFTSPAAATVTFAPSASSKYPSTLLAPGDVKAQIEAVMTGCTVLFIGGKITIVEKTPTSGVAIADTGTSNRRFGWDISNPTSSKVLVPPGVTPAAGQGQWTWAYSVNENYHTVYYWE